RRQNTAHGRPEKIRLSENQNIPSLRGIFIRKQRKLKSLSRQRILAFLFFLLRFLLCFLMKTAIAIPLKKSRKIKINVFLRGSCFQRGCFLLGQKKGGSCLPPK
ncbi:hypothetical protein, partial [Anaerotignum lactatifermentans]|uniref:hypothetical protein n=1 Tax=Anaerotignum lactatifermentans TaxID=160404 RepID=UPI003AB3B2BD